MSPTARKYTGDSIFGRRLQGLRKAQGLTLRDVEAATGISNPGISQIENGVVMPTIMTAATLAAFYGVSLDELCSHLVERTKT